MTNTGDNGLATEPIAIIGLNCKLAGEASSPARLWDMLAAGRSAWSEIPSSRFNLKGAYHPKHDRLSSTNVRGGHFLEQDLGLFDAPFFSFSAETASSLDPQIRLQLESVYEAIENAGITLPELAGTATSVYSAVFVRDYRDGIIRDEDNLPRFLPTGTGDAMYSNRISHFFDLRGPSFTLDTGCSGGLVALHQGVNSLRSGESDMAFVCGANLFLNPDMFKALSSVGLVSPDGKSYAFDSRANGFGRGEGIATLVIKRLSDAIAAGDPIRAVVRESGLNQDGKTETITTPSEEAQVALIRDCYRRAGLNPRDTQYFEAHGTGTVTGDPIECRAIATVFKDDRPAEHPLPIGSIKSNVGHTEAVSGLASLIKVVLALERGKIPPSINFREPNPRLKLADWRLQVATELVDWPLGPEGIRRASINNFGFGGTNAHLIVENSPAAQNDQSATGLLTSGTHLDSQLLVFSARDEQACRDMVSNFKLYLQQNATPDTLEHLMQSAAYTLDKRRTRFPYIAAHHVPVKNGVENAIEIIGSPKFSPVRTTGTSRVGLVFTGQGAQWYAMGRELISTYPIFEASLRETDEHIKSFGAAWSVIEELYRNAEDTRVNTLEISTPLCVAVQISLVRLLRSWGIEPVAVTSHSSGEIAAAYAAGALSCQSAMAVAYYRASLAADKSLSGATQGAMIAVGLGAQETKAYIEGLQPMDGTVTIACVNSPSSTTVSGDEPAVALLEAAAKRDGIFARRLKVQTAFHSHHMMPISDPYREALQDCLSAGSKGHQGHIIFSSPVTGGRIHDLSQLYQPEHWVDSLLKPVQFTEAFTDMILGNSDATGANVDVVVEVGPHTALGGPIKQILGQPEFTALNLPYLGCLVRSTSALESMQSLAADLLAEGLPINLDAVNFPHGRPSSVRTLSDLPQYPWNHQTRHWHESRFNKALRERTQPPHDLLGSLVLGTDLNNPNWRHTLRLRDAPWIRDHVVQNNILFPGAGFICMAIEASRQLSDLQSDSSRAVAGYRLRDVDILQALVVPESDSGVEVQTSLRQLGSKEIGSQGWRRFEISSVSPENQWTTHARGLIMVELVDAPDKTIPKALPSALSGYTRHFDPDDLYSMMRARGIYHGNAFRIITGIKQSGDNHRADCSLAIPNTASEADSSDQNLIHPITLDAALQTMYTPTLGGKEGEDAKVPRSFGRLWVSSAISRAEGHRFRTVTNLRHSDARIMRANITMAGDSNSTTLPVLEFKDAVYQSLGRGATQKQADNQWEQEPCTQLAWAPDVSLISNATRDSLKQELCYHMTDDESQVLTDLQRLCLHYIFDALAVITSDDIEQFQSHQVKYYNWMQHQLKLDTDGRLTPESGCSLEDTAEERQALTERVRQASVNGEMVCHLGPHLPAILRQEKVPIELMMEGNLLNNYYRNALRCDISFPQTAGVLQHLIHKNPRARILEIGGGTGGMTRHALQKIGTSETGGPLVSSYHFTDISPAFFKAAREEFAAWEDIMLFDKLDIEIDPTSQGFDLGSYDIVIAAQVLHATKSISKTMSHVRQLIKPGGTLLMIETTQDQIDTQFAFGLLPGWWLSEEPERAFSPSLALPFFDETLKATGFTGVDFEVRNCESDEQYMMNTIMSTAVVEPQDPSQTPEDIVLVAREQAPCAPQWLHALQSKLSSQGLRPSVVHFESATAESYQNKLVLFVGEVEEPLMHGLDAAGLASLQTMIKHSRGLLWLTRGGAVDCVKPEMALGIGFLRSIRHEYAGRKYVTLDLDPQTMLWSEASLEPIVQTFTTSFGLAGSKATTTQYELEYAERKGVILIPRLFRDSARNQSISSVDMDWTSPESLPTEPFFQPDRPLSVRVGVPGLLNTIVFDNDQTAPKPGSRFPPDMLEIEPRAYGVNFRDVLVAMGQLEEPVMGVECAGTITRVGSRAAAHGYVVGDEVFALLRGGYGSRARVEWTHAMHMPAGMSFEDAASISTVFTTVYLCFYKLCRLQRGQTVLIHAGAGGVGQAAIQFAKLLGAEVYTTVGSPDKRQLLMDRYGISADRIFSSRDASFASGILDATNGRGVDVVLNSLAGPLLQEGFNIVAPFGYFIEIGKRDLEENNYLELRPFTRHITFSSFDLLALSKHDARVIHSALAEVGRLFEERVISPVYPVTTYPLCDISKALRLLQAGKHTGKVVLTVSPQEQVRVLPERRSAQLRPDASYLLVGGAGGIGRSVAHWLVAHGARHLIVMSRNATNNPVASELVSELQPLGCRVKLISCDASVSAHLATALESCSTDFPPIRGVIQGAMVLQDSIFERMTFDDYQAALNPKVKVSWNLHNQLSASELDFFIFLSSMSGLYGYTTQSNYSAGNAYEDALAHWRVSQGLPAVALDLGPVKSVGYVADTASVAERMTKLGHYPVTEEHLLGALETSILSPYDKQVALGINQGPGPHWNPENTLSLGRDARFWALQYQRNTQRVVAEGSSTANTSLASQLAEAPTQQEAEKFIVAAIINKLADIFMIPAEHIDAAKHLSDYGLDSLGAVELRNMLALQAAADISIFSIMQSESISGLASEVTRKSTHVDSSLLLTNGVH
ncbi:hypothetical protein BDV18DRAFT_163154 [Aspergillus unguis]